MRILGFSILMFGFFGFVKSSQPFFSDLESCLEHFDLDKDRQINYSEFTALAVELFQNDQGVPYPTDQQTLRTLFDVFAPSDSEVLSRTEFEYCWSHWIHPLLHPVNALLVIDVQNDFINGSLALRDGPAGEEGSEVIEPINRLTSSVSWKHVVFSQDWHPVNHISFIENVDQRPLHPSSPLQDPSQAQVGDVAIFDINGDPRQQILWPAHCVPDTQGAELHEDLIVPSQATLIRKGTNPDIDSYSAFWDNGKLSETELHRELQARGVTQVFVCGLAYDICVGFTALHALERGYRTILVDDASRALDNERKAEIQASIRAGHGVIVDSNAVEHMVAGVDRRPELGLKLALGLEGAGGGGVQVRAGVVSLGIIALLVFLMAGYAF